MTRPVIDPGPPASELRGRHLWGGLYYGHFGHFMTETMARAWAFDRGGFDSILFVPKHPNLKDFMKYQTEICSLLGVSVPVTILRETTRVEELVVPGQGFGLGSISLGTPEYRAAMRRVAARIEPKGPERIYISRTRFNGRGGVIHEAIIEANMVANGYAIMHPEKMPLVEQLEWYRAAKHIVGLDSSAFHMVAIVADSSKKVAMILRRTNPAYQLIANQIYGMTGTYPAVIKAIAANWMDARQNEANHLSWGELDHILLASELERNGFISSADAWMPPRKEDFDKSVEKASLTSKCTLVRKPAIEYYDW